MNILLVEDDKRISDFVVKGLQENGFTIQLCTNGVKAREMLFASEWDLVLMDIMLPDISGVELVKLVRFKKKAVPIIMLSALGEPDDKVEALDAGADDYLVKPFHFKELISRINALARRTKFNQDKQANTYTCGSITLNADEHKVTQNNSTVDLSPREYKLLLFLMENKNKVMSRTQILGAVWGINYDTNTNVVDVYVSYLRNKMNLESSVLQTIVGTGYMLKDH
ncbi:response regulator transcription factor [Flavobacterium agrisoli]|uniref:Response regulator transcription factor n=1 Tax=Flavobacterium agrisoli TaxID=2793066 RepID=A0A934PJJ0_9FLAO|nr:response regulator transcription factor [Flavobacterium agrisoli]MBK0369312.1 response regulator transcription factor [Flavobacterium agrisoli]